MSLLQRFGSHDSSKGSKGAHVSAVDGASVVFPASTVLVRDFVTEPVKRATLSQPTEQIP